MADHKYTTTGLNHHISPSYMIMSLFAFFAFNFCIRKRIYNKTKS